MNELQDRFVDVIGDLDLPATALVDPVLRSLAPHTDQRARVASRPGWFRAPPRQAIVSFAAVLLLATVIVIGLEPARTAVADWLGIGATDIERLPDPQPEDPTAGSTTTLAASAGALGEPTGMVDLSPIAGLGLPTAVFDSPGGVGRGRAYTWSSSERFPELDNTGVGVVLSVRLTTGELDRKGIAADGSIEFVTLELDGRETNGLWIPARHQLLRAGTDRAVVAEHVLLWESADGAVQYRLETGVGLAETAELAEQVAGGEEWLQPL